MTWQEGCRFIKKSRCLGDFSKACSYINSHRVSGEFFSFQATFALRPHFPPIRDGHLQ